ncbi:MAG: TetR/AcrR family transcriptional regulator [Candidatus Dormibacteria bacterium]
MSSTPPVPAEVRILDAAEQLIRERGYHSVGLETVAECAGVSRQTVYDKFGSKGGLLRAMVERVEERLGIRSALAELAQTRDGVDKLVRLLTLSQVSEPGVAPFVRAMYAARLDDEVAGALHADRMAARHRAFHSVVAQLAAEGRLRPGLSVDRGADILWSIINPLHYDNLVVTRGWPIAEYRAHMETLARAALLGEAPGPVAPAPELGPSR